jgi:hypothetical protein
MTWFVSLVGGFVSVLTACIPAADAGEPARVAQAHAWKTPGSLVFVHVANGRLSVQVRDAPLAEVLAEVAARGNLHVFSYGETGERVTIEFADLTLEEGLRRLIRHQDYLLVYGRGDRESSSGRLVEVWLYPSIAGRPPVIEGRPPAGETAGEAPRAHRTLQEWAQKAQSGLAQEARTQAIHWLGSLGGEKAAGVLGNLLGREPDPDLRQEAARALARIGGHAAVSALEWGLGDQESQVRHEIIRALRRSNDAAAVAPLNRILLTDRDPGVRREAALAIGRLEGAAAGDALGSALHDPDPSVREAVERALQRWQRSSGRARR